MTATEAKSYKALAIELATKLPLVGKKKKSSTPVRAKKSAAKSKAKKASQARAKTRAALAAMGSSSLARRVRKLAKAHASARESEADVTTSAPRATVDLGGPGGVAMLATVMRRRKREGLLEQGAPVRGDRAEALRTLLVSIDPKDHAAAEATFRRVHAKRAGTR